MVWKGLQWAKSPTLLQTKKINWIMKGAGHSTLCWWTKLHAKNVSNGQLCGNGSPNLSQENIIYATFWSASKKESSSQHLPTSTKKSTGTNSTRFCSANQEPTCSKGTNNLIDLWKSIDVIWKTVCRIVNNLETLTTIMQNPPKWL